MRADRAARAVVVMGKVPRPGEVKTRLAPPAMAAQLYRAFLADVLEQVEEPGVFACAGGTIEEARALAPNDWRVVLQRGDDLGARIENARSDANANAVVILGSDAPMMPRARIAEAFEALARVRAVFGPTSDGGYYLIGMTGPCPELLTDMPWSTDQVMAETRARARRAGIAIAELEPGYDLDEPADLVRALEDPRLPPRSRAAIIELLATQDRAD
jgi:rSAM/selenodomain-associated transferase 1